MSISRSIFLQSLRMSSYFVRNISIGAKNCKTNATLEENSLMNPSRLFSNTVPNVQKDAEEVEVTFIKANGSKVKAKGKVGDSLLDVNNNLDFEGFGACEGTVTCLTCHLIFAPDDYERLPEKPSDEEFDMLDLAYKLSDTSRVGMPDTCEQGNEFFFFVVGR